MDIYTGTAITPRVVGGQNSETYWVGGSNISLITRAESIQAQRPNDSRSALIVTKTCTEGLLDEKKLSLDEFKSKITLASWIAWIKSYMEGNEMDTVFCVYDPHLKTEVYFLDY